MSARSKRKSARSRIVAALTSRARFFAGGLARRLTLPALLLTAVGVLLWRLEMHVAERRPPEPVQIQWAELPDWLAEPGNEHILADLRACSGLTDADDWNDSDLVARVAAELSRPDVGWVRDVRRVMKIPGGTLRIYCDFRRPVAWVRFGRYDYLVDADGVRLPGRYRRESSGGSGLVPVVGVRTPPPPVGAPWPGHDVGSVIQVAALLERQPFSRQLAGMQLRRTGSNDVPELILLTDQNESCIRWGSLPGEEAADENKAFDKITLLNDMYEESGRIDQNSAFIDLTIAPDRVGISESSASAAEVLGVAAGEFLARPG